MRVLILGGGSGGLVAANKVRRLLKEAEVTLVDRSPYHLFLPGLPWVAFGLRELDEIRRPLAELAKKGIEFVNGEVEAILPQERKVRLVGGEELGYDYLVVSLGAEPGETPADAVAPWSPEGALALRERLASFAGGRVVIGVSSPYYPCPPAPYEVAGMMEFALRVKGVREKSEVMVFHPNPAPLFAMGPVISGRVSEILREKGVRFYGGFELAEAGGGRVVAKDGRELAYDLLVLVPPFFPNRVVRSSPLAGEDGFPKVDPTTFSHPDFPEVFVIGDTVNPALMLPPAGVVAHFEAEYVAGVIAAREKGAYIGEPFNPVAMCIMDFGDNALLPQCSFELVLSKKGMPSCGVIASGRWVRLVKAAFERYWFATLFA